jgi:peptidoglycan/xylan/chitin deacetylase (PgdA/CDA1 family)
MPPAFSPPPILMYHRVDPEPASDRVSRELTVSPDQFEAQLAYLQSRGIQPISMEQLRERLRTGASLEHVVVLTFDDGYADQYTYALPLLHRFDDDATFYIITGNVNTPHHLTWDQLALMQSLGQDIAAHGMAHDDLSLMSPLEQARQIDNSIELLRTKLHAQVASYGYPSGRFNRTTLKLVREAGVDFAVTTDPTYVIPPETRFELPRLRVRGEWTLGDFAQAIEIALHRLRIVRR